MVTPQRLRPIATIMLCLSALVFLVCAQSSSPDGIAEPDRDSQIARARAILVAYLCHAYEIDNGRFPASEAELRWPIDYVASCSKLYGFDFSKANRDPLADGHKFLVRPVLRDQGPDAPGVWYRGENVDWWVVSASGKGALYRDLDILYAERLPQHRSFLEEPDPSIGADEGLLYISDDQIRAHVTSPQFDLKEVIRMAAME